VSDAAANDAGGSGDDAHGSHVGVVALALGALGIVYGDIGTNPLFAFREAFEHSELDVDRTSAYGVASTVFWALVVVISIKYLLLVMRADNQGEGGILALTALVMPAGARLGRPGRAGTITGVAAVIVTLGVIGTALLYGDGVITPAISVLAAVEGFEVATTAFEDWVIPATVAILVALFSVQRRGTASIGRVFGPVMVAWFIVLGTLGLRQIAEHPSVLRALWPGYVVEFFADDPMKAFLSLGSIFLVVAGGEALYADMGHFGRRPIEVAWYTLVFPMLVLNYLGQAALVADDPATIENPFYRLAPDWAIPPLAVLATMATVIASQALISGAYSLTAQAIKLDYFPRLAVRHTSRQQRGQIYVPFVNWLMMIVCIGLVVGFRSSSALAGAYGIAVVATMAITTVLFFRVVRTRFGWSTLKATAVLLPLSVIDVMFLAANVPKIPNGGWFPLLVAVVLVVQMTTWRKGRQLVARRLRRAETPIADLVTRIERDRVQRVPGTAVYMFKDTGAAPPALLINLEHQTVLHERVLILSVEVGDAPTVADDDRVEVTEYGDGVAQVVIHHGFMQEPGLRAALSRLEVAGGVVDPRQATFFLGDEQVVAGEIEGMHPWREQLYVLLDRGADSAARFFDLPTDRVVTVGTRVEI
jgi:KUP system potassium uptake protein